MLTVAGQTPASAVGEQGRSHVRVASVLPFSSVHPYWSCYLFVVGCRASGTRTWLFGR